ncbi:MAG: diguanylate cyclase [Mogibacterium sp.]|nr:diguanylate cyclase [Mogibacterium sp.]
MTYRELYDLVDNLKKIYYMVRVVDPYNNVVVKPLKDGYVDSTEEVCSKLFASGKRCDNCIVTKACKQHAYQEKYEFADPNVFHISATEIEVEGRHLGLEIFAKVDDNVIAEAYGKGQFYDIIDSVNHKLYTDPLTETFNRRYFEDFFLTFNREEAVAVIDIDNFKEVNDTYGHSIGDLALKAVADSIRSCLRSDDIVIRYGGDEFVVVLKKIPKDVFVEKMEMIRDTVQRVRMVNAPELRLSVSIGCSCPDDDGIATFDNADKQLYLAKKYKNRICVDEDTTGIRNYVRTATAVEVSDTNKYGKEAWMVKPVEKELHGEDMDHVLKAFVGDYNSILRVNLSNGDMKAYQFNGESAKWIYESSRKGYESYRREFAEKFLYPEDREWLIANTDIETLKERRKKEDVFYLDQRIVKNGILTYYQSKFVRDLSADGPWILIGGHSVDRSTRDRQLSIENDRVRQRSNEMIARLAEDYEGIYLCNIDTGELLKIRARGILEDFMPEKIDGAVDFDTTTRQFAFRKVVPEDRDAYFEFLNRENIIRMFAESSNNRYHDFRVMNGNEKPFYQVTVSMNDEDKSCRLVLVGIHSINETLIKAEKTTENEAVISAFMDGFESLGIVDLDISTLEILKKGAFISKIMDDVWVGDKLPYGSTLNDIVNKHILAEDRDKVLYLAGTDHLYTHFTRSGKPIQIVFRMKTADGVKYMELAVSRLKERPEQQRVIMGIRDVNNRMLAETARDTAMKNDILINDVMDHINDEPDPEKAIDYILEVLGSYYHGVRSYVYELDYDQNRVFYTSEWIAEESRRDELTQLNEFESITIDDMQFWIDELDEKGIYYFKDSDDPAYKETMSYKKLGRTDLTSLVTAGVWVNGELSAMIGVDHCDANMDNMFPIKTAASLAFGEIVKKRNTVHQEKVNEEIIEAIGEIVEARDYDSGRHVKRVKEITRIIAEDIKEHYPEYGLTNHSVDLIAKCSSLHDVGKVMIPDAILLKPGSLTAEEYDIMKTHCEKGCYIIDRSPVDWDEDFRITASDICRWHHEKYDGGGYPDGLKGDEIPVSAQIVAIADCYDALMSDRTYKPAYSAEKAYSMIMNGECGVFGEKILRSFARCHDKL